MSRTRKFRCGRLIITKDGTFKKPVLKEDGGTRWCRWDNDYMDFRNVHFQLRRIFRIRKWNRILSNLFSDFFFVIGDPRQKTSLYDHALNRLDVYRYRTLKRYLEETGLHALSTAIYLCTDEGILFSIFMWFLSILYFEADDDDNDASRGVMVDNRMITRSVSSALNLR